MNHYRTRIVVVAFVAVVSCTAALAASGGSQAGASPRLGAAIAAEKLPLDGLPVSADLPISSYRAARSTTETVIAYRDLNGTELGRTIGVLIYDKTAKRWSSLSVAEHEEGDEAEYGAGDVSEVRATSTFIYIDTHVNPSAGLLIVVSRDGKVRKGLWGWTSIILPDDRVVYHASQVHFAPTHPMELRVYEPGQPTSAALYPIKPWLPVRRTFIEKVTSLTTTLRRSGAAEDLPESPDQFDSSLVDKPVADKAGRVIAFLVEFGEPSKPSSPRPERVVVKCDTRSAERTTACTEERLADVIRGNPQLGSLSSEALLRRVVEGATGRTGR